MNEYSQRESGLIVPISPERTPIGVDLFAGCGGFSLGMEYGGIDVAVAVEWDIDAALTYGFNLGNPGGKFVVASELEQQWKRATSKGRSRSLSDSAPDPSDPAFFGWNTEHLNITGPGCRAVMIADVTKLSAADILAAGNLPAGSVDVVFGGPPCQGFSTAGKQDPADPRSNLILEFLRLVLELRPRTAIMENVPPLITADKFAHLWKEWQRRAVEADYGISANILDAANYGVPQRRRRALVVLTDTRVMDRPFQFPMPTHWSVGKAKGREWNMLDHDDEENTQEPRASSVAELPVVQPDLFASL